MVRCERQPKVGERSPMLAVRFARRALGLLVIAIAAFTIYGSLVPFEFHARPVQETTNAFQAAMQNWRSIESRSDALVNTLLGIPLGFGLLGLFRAGTVSRLGDLGVGAALLPACLLFAATV